ncbi:MAG: replication initiator protein [Microviridae sp.]|nr:MAG: replication initiator protein [Microviridae sp.]
MPCESPIRAYRPATGGPLLFTAPDPNRSPQIYQALDIPCGNCILCKEEHARQWAVRIAHEATLHEANSFLTLTYTNEQMPRHNSLDYSHLQKFWKRLRKQIGELAYYAVGEYGDNTLRPHYHACIFGHDFTEGSIIVAEEPHRLWENPWLNTAWGHGRVTIGQLNYKTARYTASYVTKKLKSTQQYVRMDDETGELIRVTQPRAFMSRNIGKEWWLRYGAHTTAHDFVVIDGAKQKPPKAYDKWLGEVNPAKLEQIKENRKEKTQQLTPNENHARARNAHARVHKKSKKV